MNIRILGAVALLALVTGCPDGDSPSGDTDAPTPTGETTRVEDILALNAVVDDGMAVYETNCVGCHAADGTGNGFPSIVDWLPTSTEEDFIEKMFEGPGVMPDFSSLSDQELADLNGYVQATF